MPSAKKACCDVRYRVFLEEYDTYMYMWMKYSTEYVTEIRNYFDGDFDRAVIFSVIVMHQIRRRQIDGQRKGEGERPYGAPHDEIAWTNAKSVADVTSIPRETVRRKLLALVRDGWVVNDELGRFALAVGADRRAVSADRFEALVQSMASNLNRFVCGFASKMNRSGAPCQKF